MGLVYKARQSGLNRIVAVKVIRSANDATAAERSRFRNEARAAATLQHPNIVQVYEVGVHQGCDYLSMEYVGGGSLETELQERRYSVTEAAQLIATLAAAIHVAHENGIVHRDLKPGNVLLIDGIPKISDFGLAKQLSSAAQAQTQSGAVIGTPCYMSPEQAAGRSAETSPATDIYALGAILYEMLVHRPPFIGKTAIETLDLIRSQEPASVSSFESDVPRDLDTICLKCLAKEPHLRYASAAALAEDLQRFLRHEPILARPVGMLERGWRWGTRRPVIVGLVTMLVLVSAIASLVLTRQRQLTGAMSRSAELTQRNADASERRAQQALASADLNRREATAAIDRLSRLGASLNEQPGLGATALRTSEQAAQQYEALLRQDESNQAILRSAAQSYERISWIRLEMGQPELARAAILRAIELYDQLPASTNSSHLRAKAFIMLGHALRHVEQWSQSEEAYRSAVGIFETLIGRHPDNSDYPIQLANTWLNATVVMRRDGRHEDAIDAFVRSMRLIRMQIDRSLTKNGGGPANTHAFGDGENATLDDLFKEINNARRVLQSVQSQPSDTQKELARARLLSEMGLNLDDLANVLLDLAKVDQARTAMYLALAFRQLDVELFPQEFWRKHNLARSFRAIGDHEYARGDFDRAADSYDEAVGLSQELVAAFPSRTPYRRDLGRMHLNRGIIHRKLGQADEAAASFQQSIQVLEQLVELLKSSSTSQVLLGEGLQRLGQAYAESGRVQDAITAYQESLAANPDSAEMMNRLAWLLLTASDPAFQNPSEAMKLAQRSVDLVPRDGNYLNTLGVAHYRSGDFEQAGRALREAIQLQRNGGTPYDWFFLAMTLAREGDIEAAEPWRQRAEAWCEDHKDFADDLHRIRDECAAAFRELAE